MIAEHGSTTGGRPGLDWRGVWRLIGSDAERYTHHLAVDEVAGAHHSGLTLTSGLRAVVMCQGLQASSVHRVGHALVAWQPRRPWWRGVRLGLRSIHWLLNRRIEVTTGISIAERAEIGPGLHISHFGGVIVGQVVLGAHCNLSPRVTLGRGRSSGGSEMPRLGDRCWVGPGAVVVGGIEVGDDAVIGANAVVTRSVPARATAVGSPLAVLPERPSFAQVLYPDSGADEGRAAAVRAHEKAVGATRTSSPLLADHLEELDLPEARPADA